MRILYVDDERSAHTNFQYAIKERTDISEVKYFFNYDSAISYARENRIDCAFLDITLSGKDGITLAKDLCSLQPNIELAFVTGYDEYAREAYKVGGRAYISKPYTEEEINKVLTLMEKLVHPPQKLEDRPYSEITHIFLKTFGTFDLMIDGRPVHFKNAKAKELLAFLAHQMGGTASNAQVFFALWERQEYSRATSTYVRRTVRALKGELEELGIENILISERNSVSLDFKMFHCDAYELLSGNTSAFNRYNGEYMKQYSWGEETIPLLNRIVDNIQSKKNE